MSKLQVGSIVSCRLYNTPDHKFYGDYFTATILEIIPQHKFNVFFFETGYKVQEDDGHTVILHRKEIKWIVQ